MKPIYSCTCIAAAFLLNTLCTQALAESESKAAVLILMPERVDVEWFWYHYGVGDDMIVQRSMEKALLKEGYEVVDAAASDAFPSDLTMEGMLDRNQALKIASSLQAQYLIVGKAVAVHASAGRAYGVNVHRSNVELTARLIRVEDGKLLEVMEENITEGDQSQRTAARNALKAAGKKLSRKLVRSLNHHLAEAE